MTIETGGLKLEAWRRKVTPEYQAVQVTPQNAGQIAAWAGGSLHYQNVPDGQAVVEIYAWKQGVHAQSWQLQVGDWVVLNVPEGRFEVWPDAEFRGKFERTGL